MNIETMIGPILALLFAVAMVAIIIGAIASSRAEERRKFASAKSTAETMIADVSNQSDSVAFMWLRTAGYAVAPFALPVGAAAVVAGNVALAVQKGLNLRKERMPESWYDQVANDSSVEGKAFLGKTLKAQGYISVAQAATWLEIETKQHGAATASRAHLIEMHEAQPSLFARARLSLGRVKNVQ